MRRAAAVVVVLVMLSVSGCGELYNSDDVAEKPMRERIGGLSSVVAVRSQAEGLFSAKVVVDVSSLVESDLQSIVAAGNDLLAERDASLVIATEEHSVLSIDYPVDHSLEQLAQEVDYWLALSTANGAPLGMMVQRGPYRNIFDPDETDALDWEALRAVPDPSAARRVWHLGGIWATNSMPPDDVVALRHTLGTVDPTEDESFWVEYEAPDYIEVRFRSVEAGLADPTTAANWPQVQEAVSHIAALTLLQSNFVIWDEGYEHAAFLHLGDCAEVLEDEPQHESAALVAALVSASIEFPLGIGEGFCNDAAHYDS